MNQLVVKLGFEIESGERTADPGNAKDLIEAYKKSWRTPVRFRIIQTKFAFLTFTGREISDNAFVLCLKAVWPATIFSSRATGPRHLDRRDECLGDQK